MCRHHRRVVMLAVALLGLARATGFTLTVNVAPSHRMRPAHQLTALRATTDDSGEDKSACSAGGPTFGRTRGAAAARRSHVDAQSRRAMLRNTGLGLLGGANLGALWSKDPAVAVAAAAIATAGGTRVFDGTITKSPADNRLYRALTLSNGLRVLIVTDPDARQSAAALDVHVGSYSDPASLPGLAHFTEHMLFLGTEKFPKESEFNTFLSQNGGSSNAFTDSEDTCFFFDMNGGDSKEAKANFLGPEGALDRFASFFSSPLLTASAAGRELNAVDSEHRKNLNQDVWRLSQLEKSRANPNHPYFKFSTGSVDTLAAGAGKTQWNRAPLSPSGEVGKVAPAATARSSNGLQDGSAVQVPQPSPLLREALVEFHKTYYTADVMALAVVSRESADDVQKAVEEYFAAVPERPEHDLVGRRPEDCWRGVEKPFASMGDTGVGNKPVAVAVKPVSPIRSLKMLWPLERATDPTADAIQTLSKPSTVVANLLGHEGDGSLLAELKRRGWANGLSSSASNDASDLESVRVTIALTEKGLTKWRDAAKLVFDYLSALAERGVDDYFIDECVSLAKLGFRFSDKSEPSNYCTALAGAMQDFYYSAPPTTPPASGASSLLGPARYLDGNRLFLYPSADADQVVAATAEKLKPLIQDLLPKLTAKNAILTVVAPECGSPAFPDAPKLPLKEFYYGTPYAEVSTSTLVEAAEKRAPLPPNVHPVPPPNRFIPSQFDLKAAQRPKDETLRETPPELVRDDGLWKVYFKPDKTFGQPRACVLALLPLPLSGASVEALVYSRLWKAGLSDFLSTAVYDAALAGLSYEIDVTARGIRFLFFGYDEKLPAFAAEVARVAANYDPAKSADAQLNFDRQKELFSREIAAMDTQQVYSHCRYWEGLMSETPKPTREELKAALAKADLAGLSRFATTQLWRPTKPAQDDESGKMEWAKVLAQGNMNRADVDSLVAGLAKEFIPASAGAPAGEERIRRRLTLLPTVEQAGVFPTFRRNGFDPDNENSAVQVTWQFPHTQPDYRFAMGKDAKGSPWPSKEAAVKAAIEDGAVAEVLGVLLNEPFFDRLRTQRQLGYIVSSGVRDQESVRSLLALVQSSSYTSQQLLAEIADFFKTFESQLAAVTEADITRRAQALIDRKLEKDKRLYQEVDRNWNEIAGRTPARWDRRKVEADALRKVTKRKLLEFYRRFVDLNSPERRVLAVAVEGKGKSSAASTPLEVPIAEWEDFKKAASLVPERGLY